MVFFVQFPEQKEYSVLIDENLRQHYGVSMEELSACAMKNKVEQNKPVIDSMRNILFGMDAQTARLSWKDQIAQLDPDEGMYVLTNADKLNGAVTMSYPGVLEDIAEKLKGNFYLIPSSIHETIILPDDGRITLKEVSQMVSEVNQQQVAAKEQLCDHAFLFDYKEKMLKREPEQKAKKSIHEQMEEKKQIAGAVKTAKAPKKEQEL